MGTARECDCGSFKPRYMAVDGRGAPLCYVCDDCKDYIVKCDCGSGKDKYMTFDGRGIPLCSVCDDCKREKLARYRPEILRHYTQSDVDEPIEPED